MALAVSREWKDLALPGIVVGLFGFPGTDTGFAIAAIMRHFL